jgi:hypothetical protein
LTSYRIARRSFLRSCGAGAALVPLLRNIEARAQGLPAPLRFLIIHHPLGTQLDLWRPTGVTATTTTFTLPANSAPFAPLQSKMVMIDGMNIVAATKAAGGAAGDKTHEGGVVAIMTGQPTLGRIGQQDHAAGGRSIDQIFLDESPLLGGKASDVKTPFGSLQLAADIRSDRDEVAPRVLSYLDPLPGQTDISLARQPLYPETQPLNVYNRIFGGTLPTGMDPGTSAARLAQQKSVLDFMRADLARLRGLVPASETGKLDQYADAVQKLESSIRFSLQPTGCQKPPMPMSFQMTGAGASGGQSPAGGTKLSGVDYYIPNDPTSHPHADLGRLQLQMIQSAFQCDLVRVGTFMWSAGTNWVVFPGNFNGAQVAGGLQSSPHHPPTHTTDANTVKWVAEIDKWYAQQTAAALQQFEAAKDFDGNSLLDNTVVAYVSEVARAYDHDFRNVPYLVFGGKNTKLKGGTFLKATGGPLPDVAGTPGNRPTNDVWLALAQVFGVNRTSLGATSQSTGPLPGLVSG